MITKCKILSKAEFEALNIAFKCFDPVGKKEINFQFTSSHFDKVDEGFGLFKIAAKEKIAGMDQQE